MSARLEQVRNPKPLTAITENNYLTMRHSRRVPKLGRPADQRRALLRGLTTQLLRHGSIKVTLTRAKAVRSKVDKMITLAKDGSLNARRRALAYLYDEKLVHAMFDQAQERYGDRPGGYTAIRRTVRRRGDNAEMAIIDLMGAESG